jgi:Protein of unknown function (DUF3592)
VIWLGVVGGLLVLAGLGFAARRWAFTRRAVSVTGRITKVRTTTSTSPGEPDRSTGKFYFRTREGRDVSRPVSFGIGRPFGKGDEVPVVYDPADPTRAYLDVHGYRGWHGAVVCLGVGLCLLLISSIVALAG